MTSPQKRREHYPAFDVLRIVAALAVILSHSFPLTGHREPFTLHAGDTSFSMGTDAVIAFFVISGFLITMSWHRDSSVRSYASKRFARIYPGFAVVVTIGVFVLGPLATTLSTKTYFTNRQTWSYYLHTMVMAPIMHTLPGVFSSNPLTSVNGSLWTLPYEVLCYVGLLFLALIGLLRHRWLVVALLFVAAAIYEIAVASHHVSIAAAHLGGITGQRLLPLVVAFLVGACLYLFREMQPFRVPIAAVAALMLVGGALFGQALFLLFGFSFLVVYAGTRPWSSADLVRRHGDPSYGIYLYAWPVQQVIVAAGVSTPLLVFGIASPIAIAFGFASWFLVERRAMRTMRRFAARPDQLSSDLAP